MDFTSAIQAALRNPNKRSSGRQNFPPYLDRQVDYYRIFVSNGWLYLVDLGAEGGRVVRYEDGAEIDLMRCPKDVQMEIYEGLRRIQYYPEIPPTPPQPPQTTEYRGFWRTLADILGW